MTGRSVIFLVSHSSAGGAQEIWANLAESFSEAGDRVRLMALYPSHTTVRASAAHLPWEYVVPRRPAHPLAMIGLLGALRNMIARAQPDIIFTALPAANALASVAARLAGVPTKVVTSHHSPVETHNRAIDMLDSVAGTLSSVKAIVSVSDVVGRSLDRKPQSYLSKRKTIHNALPPRIERVIGCLAENGHRAALGRRVVATGRLAAQKNYPALIRAAVHLPDVTFDIIGNGPDEAALKGLATELGVADRVRFLGFHPREKALELLSEGDVFAQVSLFEGHSLALIEAAKLGLPLVVSDVPVQIEGITAPDGTRCGTTVPAMDDRAIAEAIRNLLDDPELYARQAALARRLGETATFDAMFAAYRALAA